MKALTPASTFDTAFQMPEDANAQGFAGDDATAASIEPLFQGLLNRTQYLFQRAATFADLWGDFVVAGLLAAASANLTTPLPAGVAYAAGQRVAPVDQDITVQPSQDTYVDVDNAGVLHLVGVANGAAAPALTANSIRLMKLVSSATAITGVTDLRTLIPAPLAGQAMTNVANTFTRPQTFEGNASWTGSGWQVAAILGADNSGGNAIRFGMNTAQAWGFGATNGNLYFIRSTATDTSAASNYPLILGADDSATFGGKAYLIAPTTATATLNTPQGSAPTSPINGDLWASASADVFWQLNGAAWQVAWQNRANTFTQSQNLFSADSQAAFGTAAGQGYLLGHPSIAALCYGVDYVGGQFTAEDSFAGMVYITTDGFRFYYDTGLAPGSVYSPTQRVFFDVNGNATFNGQAVAEGGFVALAPAAGASISINIGDASTSNGTLTNWIFDRRSDNFFGAGTGGLSIWGNLGNSYVAPILLTATGDIILVGADNATNGKVIFGAPTTAKASLKLTPGVAPTSPEDGEIWPTATGLYAQLGGVTKQLDAKTATMGLRNCVTGAPSIDYITGSGAALEAGITGPINVTWADGFNADGTPKDLTAQIATDASFWSGLAASATNYLFIDYGGGSPSGLSSTVAPVFVTLAPLTVNVTTIGAAESGGDNAGFPDTNVFDGDAATLWSSLQVDSARDGVSHIGRAFGSTVRVTQVTVAQGNSANFSSYNCSDTVQFRYSNDGVTWTEIGGTTPLSTATSDPQTVLVPDYPGGDYFDMLRISGPDRANNDTWVVSEMTLVTGVAGARLYDAIQGQMYYCDGTTWAAVQEVAAGQVTTNATNATAQVSYPVSRQQSVVSAVGTTSGPSTTTVTPAAYILPDPRLTVTVGLGQNVALSGACELTNSTNGSQSYAQLVRSSDGGTTWSLIGALGGAAQGNGGTSGSAPLSWTDTPGVGSYTYGISIWAGANTAEALSTYRALSAQIISQ